MKKRSKSWGVAAVLAVFAGATAWALWPASEWVPTPLPEVTMTCGSEATPVAWSYCVNQVSGSRNGDVVYHLHGRNGAATWWNDQTYYTGEVQQLWKDRGIAPPTVVSVSFGPLWLLTDHAPDAPDGLMRVFLGHVIPTVEATLGRAVTRRMVVGESMGGVNALAAGLEGGSLFSRVAALCPPLPTVAPTAPFADKRAYVQRSNTSWQRAAMLMWFAKKFYPDEASWRAHNPVPRSSTFDPSTGVRFYLSCGRKDDWGCQEGSEAIVANIRGRGGAIEWHLRPGGHCDIDEVSLAAFLVEGG